MLPRDAFFAAKETVSADNAIGRIAAEQPPALDLPSLYRTGLACTT
jgi:hypothetical protein